MNDVVMASEKCKLRSAWGQLAPAQTRGVRIASHHVRTQKARLRWRGAKEGKREGERLIENRGSERMME